MEGTQSGPSNLTTPKPPVDAGAPSTPCLREESSLEGAFIPMNNILRFYGYKVNSQLGVHVKSPD